MEVAVETAHIGFVVAVVEPLFGCQVAAVGVAEMGVRQLDLPGLIPEAAVEPELLLKLIALRCSRPAKNENQSKTMFKSVLKKLESIQLYVEFEILPERNLMGTPLKHFLSC